MIESNAAEGWYPDPSGALQRRYWDGTRWTDRFAYATGPIQASADPVRDLDELRRSARRAKVAVAVGVPVYAVGPAVQGRQARESRRAVAEVQEQLEFQRQVAPGVQVRPMTNPNFESANQLLALPALVVCIVFVIWFYRAATIATRLRRGAQRTPGWAVGGWLIPVGNFYLPYQSARDIFREQEPGRLAVKRWWAGYLVAASLGQALVIITGFNPETEYTVAACSLAFAVWMLAAILAWEFIDDSTASLSAELHGHDDRRGPDTGAAGGPLRATRS